MSNMRWGAAQDREEGDVCHSQRCRGSLVEVPSLDLNVPLRFHLVTECSLQVPSRSDSLVEEPDGEVECVIEGWSDGVFQDRRRLHHVVPTLERR